MKTKEEKFYAAAFNGQFFETEELYEEEISRQLNRKRPFAKIED